MGEVRTLLADAADTAGEFVAPPVERLVRRGRRRRALRAGAAVTGVVAVVAGIAVAVHLASPGPRPVAAPPTQPAPAPVPISALVHGHWRTLPAAPIAGRSDAAGVWTGSQLLVWGGGVDRVVYADGASYDPATRAWQKLPPSPLSARADPAYAWTGRYLFVWGGQDAAGHSLSDGALYDPAARAWHRLPSAPIDKPASAQAVAADGRVVLLTGRMGAETIEAVEYLPDSNSWTPRFDLHLPKNHELLFFTPLAAGDRVFIWSMWSHSTKIGPHSYAGWSGVDPYVFETGRRQWTSAPAVRPIDGTDVRQPLWDGRQVIIPSGERYCGDCTGPWAPPKPGRMTDPDTGTHSAIAALPPSAYQPASLVWTGSALLAVEGGFSEHTATRWVVRPGGTALWNPSTNRWSVLPRAPFVAGTGDAVIVWAGDRVLVWGELSGSPSGGIEFVPAGR